jgi:hypothetical protein
MVRSPYVSFPIIKKKQAYNRIFHFFDQSPNPHRRASEHSFRDADLSHTPQDEGLCSPHRGQR